MIYLKAEDDRARVNGIRPEAILAVMVAYTVFGDYGYKDMGIASVTDYSAKRGKGSRHPMGLAVDIRVRDLPLADRKTITNKTREALGPEYDVVLYDNHIHVEYDPEP